MSIPRLLLLALSAVFLHSAQAAECGNADLSSVLNSQTFDPVILYGARQSMCMGKPSCDTQDTTRCMRYFRLDAEYDVTFTATADGKKYTQCFTALEDIIESCFKKGHSDSSWTYNDETYRVKIARNPLEGQYIWDDPGASQPDAQVVLVNAPDLLVDAPKPETTTEAPQPTPVPDPPACPEGKACPDPKPVEELDCNVDCCGVIPNPDWCIQTCGGIQC